MKSEVDLLERKHSDEIAKLREALEAQHLVVTHRDRQGKLVLVKATYEGLKKAFPREYYQWYPDWYSEEDKF